MLPAMDINAVSAVVTGGASGIGAAVVRQLADRGTTVVVADLQEESGSALAEEVGGAFVKVDVTRTEDVVAAVEKAESLGTLRVLVNSAGIGWAQRTVGKDGTYDSAANLDAFKKVIADQPGRHLQLHPSRRDRDGADRAARGRRARRHREPRQGVAAFDGQIGQAAYSASKGGVVGMTLPIARDLSAIGVRVVTVAPGLVDTPIYGEGEASEAFKASLEKGVLFPKRLGRPEEVASVVVECLTNSYLNGETVRVDGGIRMPPK